MLLCFIAELIQQESNVSHAGVGFVGQVSWRRHSTLQLLSHLSPAELRAVYSVPAASNADDLKLFARYCRVLVIDNCLTKWPSG